MTTSSPYSMLLIAMSLSLCACSKQSNTETVPNEPQTVMSASQERTLNKAKHMEETLQHNVDLREQKMRDQGI